MSDNPIKRCALLVLELAQRDQATELVVRASPGSGAPVRYKVAGTWHDWKSPGRELAPGIISEIGKFAAFTRRPFPTEGLIDMKFSGVRLLWVVSMASADADCVLTPVEQ